MIYFAVSIGIFLLSLLLHALIHKLLARKGKVSMFSLTVFFFGFAVNVLWINYVVTDSKVVSYPYSSLFFYVLISVCFMILYGGLVLDNPKSGEVSPSGHILQMLHRKKSGLTLYQIENEFSEDNLVGKRLQELISSGIIIKKKKKYQLLPKGWRLITIIRLYRRILGWLPSG